MGRAKFAVVLEKILELKRTGFMKLCVYGTIGYGKSHILAAVACYLMQQGKKVIYLLDCHAMLRGFVRYVKDALLLAFGDSPNHQQEIAALESADDIAAFSERIYNEEIDLYFIVDQMNALDFEEDNKDASSNGMKEKVSEGLNSIMYGHYVVKSASANYRTAMHMEMKQTNELKISLFGGLEKVSILPLLNYYCLLHTLNSLLVW